MSVVNAFGHVVRGEMDKERGGRDREESLLSICVHGAFGYGVSTVKYIFCRLN